MPAYNSRKFINPTLSDISRQIYCDWELIVVEDGSDNPIGDVIERFRTKHPRHRIVYHAKPFNSGVSSTRNVAFRLCHGEFIAFLDADDRWCPDHLQRKVRLLRKTGCDLAYSRVDAFDSASDKSLCFWGPTDEELEKFPASMFNRPYMQPSGMVVHRSLVDDVGDFDEKLHFAEDYDYHFRAIRAGKLFCFDEKVTSRYRKNHASAATTDRMVVCCQGAAEVASRHFALLKGDDAEARRVTAKHFMMAGTGHLGFRPTTRNRCDPVVGRHCLAEALRVGGKTRSERKYAFLARVAATTRTTALFRPIFRRRYQRFWN